MSDSNRNEIALEKSGESGILMQPARRDFLGRGMKLTAGGILAPSLILPAVMGASDKAEAVQTVGYSLTVDGHTYLYRAPNNHLTFVNDNGAYIGKFDYVNGAWVIYNATDSSRSYNPNSHRKLATFPAISYQRGTTHQRRGPQSCATSIYGLSELVRVGYQTITYASVYIYNGLSTNWDEHIYNLSNDTDNKHFSEYVALVTTAAAYEFNAKSAAGIATIAAMATAAAGCTGLAGPAIAAGIGALILARTAKYYDIKYTGALELLQNFRRRDGFNYYA